MTQEQKAKAYDEALKVLHKYDGANIMFSQSLKEEMFPELKESEDEQIRKRIIHALHGDVLDIEETTKAIAWLEKQGEQKPTDKIEPKFKVGDWVCANELNDYANLIKIIKIVEVFGKKRYKVSRDYDSDLDLVEFDFIEKYYHLWTIQDAKDGDVLATKDAVFIFKHKDKTGLSLCKSYCEIIGNSKLGFGFDFSINGVYPATKEKRDLLFEKMKEAGYEWDAEKKELKKIADKEQIKKNLQDNSFRRMFKQKPAWSEEDDKHLQIAINYTFSGGYLSTVDWLNSLKDRYTWKPSDEQMKFVWKYAEQNNYDGKVFTRLYNDLKKLKGE